VKWKTEKGRRIRKGRMNRLGTILLQGNVEGRKENLKAPKHQNSRPGGEYKQYWSLVLLPRNRSTEEIRRVGVRGKRKNLVLYTGVKRNLGTAGFAAKGRRTSGEGRGSAIGKQEKREGTKRR